MLAASDAGDIEQIKKLIKNGKRLDIKDNHGWTSLHFSVFKAHIHCVKYLLNSVFAEYKLTQAKTHEGETSLYLACGIKTINLDIIRLLIQADPNSINITNNESETPLHNACNNQNSKCVELLVNLGADLDKQDYAGDTALHISSMNGDYDSLEILLYAGADTTIKNERGYTALHLSIMNKYNNSTDCILDFTYSEDVNIQNIHGTTALIIAAHHDNKPLVKKLLAKGADPHISDYNGRFPFQFAEVALKPLIKSMDSNKVISLNYSKFKFSDSREKYTKLCEMRPELFALFVIDYLWDSWCINKSQCIFLIEILLSQLSLNYDFECNYVPLFHIKSPREFSKLLDIADTFAFYGQEITVLWRNYKLTNEHSTNIRVELPIELWALRALSCVNPYYSPLTVLKELCSTGKYFNLQIPYSWEFQYEENNIIEKFPSLKHLSRGIIRQLFCNCNWISYNKFQQKLQQINLPKCLILYIQYMEEYDK